MHLSNAILALNAGSSSIKFALYEIGGTGEPEPLAKGQIAGLDAQRLFTAEDSSGAKLADRRLAPGDGAHDAVLGELIDWVEAYLAGRSLAAAGHRIVHGGLDFVSPVRITPDVIRALDQLTPLAPLHQPLSLAPIRALAALRPDLPQVACFDTAFHHDLQPPVRSFALPAAYEASGIRRYGFHGISYEFIAGRLREISPALAVQRVVVAHLGSGCSLCAMRDGKSLDTTMGFTALDGLMMGTRCGAIDPGILLYLMQARGMSVASLEHLLYHESGLLGVSGISADMQTLLASDDPRAAEAVELFVFRISREIAAMANTLGGLDCIVFTGGIGEHAGQVRAQVCDRLAWLGVEIDRASNDMGADLVSSEHSRIGVRVIATNEEMTIARHTLGLIGKARY
jgi:acetate kinase